MSAHLKPKAGRTYVMLGGVMATVTGVNGNLVYYIDSPSLTERRLDFVSFTSLIRAEVAIP